MKPFSPIARAAKLPPTALDWFQKNNLTPPAENRLEILNLNDDSVEINLLGSVGDTWDETGITEKELRAALDTAKGKKIQLNVNSPGGYVSEGLGLYNAINSRRQDITCKITGYALSAASFFPLAASKVISPANAIWMIHPAQWVAMGSASDLRKTADALDIHDQSILGIYQKKTGKPAAEIKAAMERETWMTGAEAVAFGLAEAEETEDPSSAAAAANANGGRAPAPPAASANLAPGAMPVAAAPFKQSPATPPANQPQPQPPQKMNEPTPTAAAPTVAPNAPTPVAAAPAVSRDEFNNLITALAAQNKAAVEAKVLAFVATGHITNDEAPIYVAAAMNDEAGTLAILNKKEPAINGSVISFGASVNMPAGEGVLQLPEVANIVNEAKGDQSVAFRKVMANWETLYKKAQAMDLKRGMQPMNANSISGFLTAFLLSGSLTPLQNKWAPLMALCRDYSTDPYKPLATATLKNPTAASATLTDATTFNSGNSTVGALTATMHQYTQPFQINNTDLNSGLRMEDLVTINQAAFADKIISVALAPVTAANFNASGDAIISSAAAFGFNELATAQGLIQKANKRNLILDGTYIARIANTPGFFQQSGTVNGNPGAWSAFGWDGIYLNSNWTGAGANIKGIALDPQAIFGIMGLPLTPVSGAGGGIFNVNTITIPGVNVSVAIYTWWDVNTRTMWTSYDLVAGFGLGDGTAGKLIASGTPG